MEFPTEHKIGTIKKRELKRFFKKNLPFILLFLLCVLTYLCFLCIPNPFLCYGYNPIKIGKAPIEFDWTGKSYQCRFGIGNSGFFAVKNPQLHLTFIDKATVTLDSENKEWQANDYNKFFWSKDIVISGGIFREEYFAERAWPINVIFHKKGINRIKYIITSNGIQKTGIIKAINKY
ncbi:MAG TPA: hypothetical protein VMW81_09125 [Nitrospinota bacterium]|nr:hypothetical protein [Nitrospinota bacterium]